MKSSPLASMLLNQFSSHWNLLRQAVVNCPDEDWSLSENDWSFSRVLYHVIETVEFYFRHEPEGMQWGKRAGIAWDVQSEDKIKHLKLQLSKTVLQTYSTEIENKTAQVLKLLADQEFYSQNGFKWFETRLDKFIYVLRHSMLHIGECNKALRDRNTQRIKWR